MRAARLFPSKDSDAVRRLAAPTRITMVIPKELDLQLEMLCATQGRKKSEAVVEALRQYLEASKL